ncbi:conserved unknown protein [Ectocarpus siliculosus]|uniref:C2HC/C3H-type domain-containing protein n=1 Tax=Ectocarpus siliculosus TaxID=2880 RepID=D8LBF1_ECTSI|nr:conserved unknown protein [Ectocarpus siliculosus]|eukprot:CBN76660.1 conserved unknown protein [Ectocarpus siliculosus]
MESGSAAWGGGEGRGPKVRICYVCGRGYGLSSYEIHLKQCKAKWEATQERLPKSERKPLPQEPDAGDPLGGKGSLEAQNEAATQVFNTESLEACANCGRTFLKERLIIHQKSCTSSSPAKRVGAARLSSSDELPTTTVHRPRTSRKSKTAPGHSSGAQRDESVGTIRETKVFGKRRLNATVASISCSACM